MAWLDDGPNGAVPVLDTKPAFNCRWSWHLAEETRSLAFESMCSRQLNPVSFKMSCN